MLCTASWISGTYTRIPLFWISAAFRSPQSLEESRPSCAVGWVLIRRLLYVVAGTCVRRAQPPGSSRPPLSLPVSTCVPCTSTSPFLLCKQDRLYQFCSDCIYVLTHGTFLLFLTWLYSVWICVHKYNGILLNYESNEIGSFVETWTNLKPVFWLTLCEIFALICHNQLTFAK